MAQRKQTPAQPPSPARPGLGRPFVLRLFLAQLVSVPATLIIFPVLGGLLFLPLSALITARGLSLASDLVLIGGIAAVLLLFGLILGSWQRLFLAKWIARSAAWRWSSTLGGAVLLAWTVFLTSQMSFPPPAGLSYNLNGPEASQLVSAVSGLSFLGGWLSGMTSGLLLGLLQGRYLSQGRRAWWLLSALAWALAVGLLLAGANVNALFSVNSD